MSMLPVASEPNAVAELSARFRNRSNVALAAASARFVSSLRQLRLKPDQILHTIRRDVALRRLRGFSPRSVVFVCHGNVCRSPFAAAVFEKNLPESFAGRVTVSSGGFIGPGRPAPPPAIDSAARRGIDISAHRSSPLTPAMLNNADLVVVVSGNQKRLLAHQVPVGSYVLVLGDLDPFPISERTILDPWNGGDSAFELSYERIDRCVKQLISAVSANA